MLNGLKGADRRAELPALPGVIQHFLQLAQRGSCGPRAQAQPIESDNRVVDRCECARRGGEFELREQRFPQEQLIPLTHTGVIQIHPGKGRLPLCCANDDGNVCSCNRIDEIDCAANRAVERICGIEVRDEPRGFDTERRDDFARVNLRQPGGLRASQGRVDYNCFWQRDRAVGRAEILENRQRLQQSTGFLRAELAETQLTQFTPERPHHAGRAHRLRGLANGPVAVEETPQ